ncbi:MAG: hypothetical protein HYV63_30355 [Candidatus Schekmanbacteria bacterium]|nr:hypothetical protein [Candidatus Schekmanbacteria bacterium]
MRKSAACFLVAMALAASTDAMAAIGTIDAVPSSTLLLPYFEVDLLDTSGNGVNTLFTIQNASATAVLAHVTYWTDLGVPTLRHNIYLTGFDQETVDLRETFQSGKLSRTASVGQDPSGMISPKGPYSQDINFASCTGLLPPVDLTADELAQMAAAHTGSLVSFMGGCTALDRGDNVARGYITVDTVNNCTLRVPSDVGYFVSGGLGDATNQPVLVGRYAVTNRGQQQVWGDALTHVEASGTNPLTTTAGNRTFYGALLNATAADNREPLATSWAGRFFNDPAGPGGNTELVIWRDPDQPVTVFSCGNAPAWYPLGLNSVVAFDEQENVVSVAAPGSAAVPAVANRIAIGGAELPVPYASGWLSLDLNTAVVGGVFAYYQQSSVTFVQRVTGSFAAGTSGLQLDNASDPNPPAINP